MRRVWVVASFALLVLPVAAMAQRGAGMRGGGMVAVRSTTIVAPHAAVSGPHIVLRASTGSRSGATVVRRRPGGTIIRNVNGSSRLNNVSVFSTMNVPGLGFDYPHLAAVTSGHGRGRSGIGQGGAFGFGGFLLSPEIIVDNPQAVEEAQQSAAEEGPATNVVADGREAQREYFPRTNPAPEPPKDDTEYVFVRRDGGLLFAVGYSWENGTLRYVTREGLRKSVTQDLLDLDATQQFNEQRGLNFRIPA